MRKSVFKFIIQIKKNDIPWIILMYKANGAVVKSITSGWPEKSAKNRPPAACAIIVFWTVIFPLVVPSFKLPNAIDGRRQAKYRKIVVEITLDIDFPSKNINWKCLRKFKLKIQIKYSYFLDTNC